VLHSCGAELYSCVAPSMHWAVRRPKQLLQLQDWVQEVVEEEEEVSSPCILRGDASTSDVSGCSMHAEDEPASSDSSMAVTCVQSFQSDPHCHQASVIEQARGAARKQDSIYEASSQHQRGSTGEEYVKHINQKLATLTAEFMECMGALRSALCAASGDSKLHARTQQLVSTLRIDDAPLYLLRPQVLGCHMTAALLPTAGAARRLQGAGSPGTIHVAASAQSFIQQRFCNSAFGKAVRCSAGAPARLWQPYATAADNQQPQWRRGCFTVMHSACWMQVSVYNVFLPYEVCFTHVIDACCRATSVLLTKS
jgi:hypothetical protein